MATEIVDLPMKNGGSFHSYVKVYQRVWGPSANLTPAFLDLHLAQVVFWFVATGRAIRGVMLIEKRLDLLKDPVGQGVTQKNVKKVDSVKFSKLIS